MRWLNSYYNLSQQSQFICFLHLRSENLLSLVRMGTSWYSVRRPHWKSKLLLSLFLGLSHYLVHLGSDLQTSWSLAMHFHLFGLCSAKCFQLWKYLSVCFQPKSQVCWLKSWGYPCKLHQVYGWSYSNSASNSYIDFHNFYWSLEKAPSVQQT